MTALPAEDAAFPDALTPVIRRVYRSAWREFVDFCARRGLPALPATSETVTAFAGFLAWEWTPDGQPPPPGEDPGKSEASLQRALYAISAAHQAAGVSCPAMGDAWEVAALRKAAGSPRGPGRPRSASRSG